MDNKRFQPKPFNTILMLVAVAVCLKLAHWQMGRIEEKQLLEKEQAALQQAPAWNLNELEGKDFTKHAWQPVSARGEFLVDHAFYLDSQVYQGKPGYNYIVPLKLEGKDQVILVNLGWLAAGNRNDIPAFPDINLEQPVIGHLAQAKSAMPGFETEDAEAKVKLFINTDVLSDRIGAPLIPMVLRLDENLKATLPRDWPEFQAKVEMHEFYVIHWLVVAFAIVLIYIYFGFKSSEKQDSTQNHE